eukprot:2227419-Pyramimonas_sp.AAC.1
MMQHISRHGTAPSTENKFMGCMQGGISHRRREAASRVQIITSWRLTQLGVSHVLQQEHHCMKQIRDFMEKLNMHRANTFMGGQDTFQGRALRSRINYLGSQRACMTISMDSCVLNKRGRHLQVCTRYIRDGSWGGRAPRSQWNHAIFVRGVEDGLWWE